METIWRRVLNQCDGPVVLLDLGASAGPPEIWKSIAPCCTYVGFEPDRRSQLDAPDRDFGTTAMICAAATAVDQPTAHLYLTQSRFCSSTLPPDEEHLRKFAFASLFQVEATDVVPAMTIDRALLSHGLNRVHWFKADTQGTDLRLFQSLNSDVRSRILAVDVEPGLIRAYQGEDFFTEAHEYFTANGFWLSSMIVGTNTRGSQQTLGRIVGDGAGGAERVPHQYRQTPVCCEARYLRELVPGTLTSDDLALLATFAAMDNQPLFAVEAIEGIPPAERSAAVLALSEACAAAVRGASTKAHAGFLARAGRRLGSCGFARLFHGISTRHG